MVVLECLTTNFEERKRSVDSFQRSLSKTIMTRSYQEISRFQAGSDQDIIALVSWILKDERFDDLV
jgi:uncharacterized lipoprotein YmbA